ncbi:hypothetical protein [Streptomyces sp. NPDC045369]|uniref:hypothetical protein n=1 Tax=Streptomyces sp. NPDC045369 TaxID=3155732 RepID=UPI0033C956C7
MEPPRRNGDLSALWTRVRRPEAEAETGQAWAAQLRRRHLHPSSEAAEQAAATAAREARLRVAEHLLGARSRAWLAAQAPQPAGEPGEPDREAAANVARALAALALPVSAVRNSGKHRPERSPRRSRALMRGERAQAQDAAGAQETARLRAQIAAQLPELAAATAAHHGASYIAAEAVGSE